MLVTKILVATTILISTGQTWEVKCFQGQPDKHLMEAAREHAIYMAKIQVQGHQGWDSRYADLGRRLGHRYKLAEVCAESWPGQTKVKAADEMYRSWYATRIYQDQGHWGAINKPAKLYGFAMARGTNGVWYACGIVAN